MHAVSDIGALVEWLQANIEFGHDQPTIWLYSAIKIVWSMSLDSASCAGMTAFMVVVAQTKVGFLTEGRGQRFRDISLKKRGIQRRRDTCSSDGCPYPAKCVLSFPF